MVSLSDFRNYILTFSKPNHKVPVPRWTLQLPKGVTHIYTLYIGVQAHGSAGNVASRAHQSVRDILDGEEGRPTAIDVLQTTEGFDIVGTQVWVAYWTNGDAFKAKLDQLDLVKIWNRLGNVKQSVGIWCEHFETPIERLETNYASLLHRPGVSQVPNSDFPAHNLTAYWGAGRDRLPGSKDDLFHPPENTKPPEKAPNGIGERLTGTNFDNMCHISKRLCEGV